MGFPVWSKAVHAKGTVKATVGSVNTPIVCAGALVHPGDVVFADDDGVVIVPKRMRRSRGGGRGRRETKEAGTRKRLASGELGIDIYAMRESLAKAGSSISRTRRHCGGNRGNDRLAKNPLKSCLPPDPASGLAGPGLPPGACDAHCHVFGPAGKFPYSAGPQLHAARRPGRKPAPAACPAWHLARRHRARELPRHGHGCDLGRHRIERGALSRRGLRRRCGDGRRIAASAHGRDSRHSIQFRQAPGRACRTWRSSTGLVARIKPLGWHVVLHFDAEDILTQQDLLRRIDVPFIIDHMGRVKAADGLEQRPFQLLLDSVPQQSPGMDQGLRRRARVGGQAAVSGCGAVRARADRQWIRSAFSGAPTGRTRISPRTCPTTASWSISSRRFARTRRCGSAFSWITRRACIGADTHDHRLPRSLHHRARRAAEISRRADRRPERPASTVPLSAQAKISDDEIRDSLENAQLKLQRARGTDLTIFSPRASAMAHHIGNETTSRRWTEACNDLIHRVCTSVPGELRRGVPIAAIARRARRRTAPRSSSAASRSWDSSAAI